MECNAKFNWLDTMVFLLSSALYSVPKTRVELLGDITENTPLNLVLEVSNMLRNKTYIPSIQSRWKAFLKQYLPNSDVEGFNDINDVLQAIGKAPHWKSQELQSILGVTVHLD